MARRARAAERSEEDDEKRGPRYTATLHGQDAAERALVDALRADRLHHAWMLTGERGVGKATLAFRLARYVLAHGTGGAPTSLAVDLEHPVFRRAAARGHSDLLTVERGLTRSGEAASGIAVDDVRAIGTFLHKTAGEGDWRVVVVDCADDLNAAGANALLKILEEPPTGALLVLVCHSPGRLPATVVSRCRRLALSPLDQAAVATIVSEQRPEAPEEAVLLAARLAHGSAGAAIEQIDEGGVALYRRFIGVLEGLPELDIAAAHSLADAVGERGADTAWRLVGGYLARWLADVARASHAPIEDVLGGEGALARRMREREGRLEPWIQLWEKTIHLIERADALNLDRKHVLIGRLLAIQATVRSTS